MVGAAARRTPSVTRRHPQQHLPPQQPQPFQQQHPLGRPSPPSPVLLHQQKPVYISTPVWFSYRFSMLLLPFAVGMGFLVSMLDRSETMWSRGLSIVGSVVCYMTCWGFVVTSMKRQQRLLQQQQQQQQQQQIHHQVHVNQEYRFPNNLSSTNNNINNMFNINNSGGHAPFAMEYEFEVYDTFTPSYSTNSYNSTNYYGHPHHRQASVTTTTDSTTLAGPGVQPQNRGASVNNNSSNNNNNGNETSNNNNDDDDRVSAPLLSWLSPKMFSLVHWMVSSRFVQDLVTRITKRIEMAMDDCSEFLGITRVGKPTPLSSF
ncbi:hypothetical protein BGZ65_007998 [Modicella reniformis]|uniref:Uncharacterized protein n=1 Tax=Modicella reniformis TaxID=1440133 RepID=A0A9P6JGL4_9FUNG|nr:hypothetical protein BGZ65_007998 [Modicella reniformis]